MPEVAIGSSALMAKYNRLDAKFAFLFKHYPGLEDSARELMEKFTREEMLALVDFLPFDSRVANAILPTVHIQGRHEFETWLKRPERRLDYVALYAAVVARHGASKILEQVLEMRKQELALIQQLKSVLDMAAERGATLLQTYLKGERALEKLAAGKAAGAETDKPKT